MCFNYSDDKARLLWYSNMKAISALLIQRWQQFASLVAVVHLGGCTDVPVMCFVTAVMVLLAERPCPSLGRLKKAEVKELRVLFGWRCFFMGAKGKGISWLHLQNPTLVRMKTDDDDEWMMQTQNPSLFCVLWMTRNVLAVCAKRYSSSTEMVLIQAVSFQGHESVRESCTKADHYPLGNAIFGWF